MLCDGALMRIDTTSLIAAQSVQRPAQPSPRPPQSADKPLFEPLNFPRAAPDTAPVRTPGTGLQTALRRPGGQLDITV
jgi:hypothetical protein